MTDLTIITRSLTGRLFSTITTIATVAVAVALLLVLLSMRDSGKKAFDRGGGNMHMLVAGPGADPMTAILNGVFYSRLPRTSIPWAQYEELTKKYPLEWAIPIQQGDSYNGYAVLATMPEFFTKFAPAPDGQWRFAAGKSFENDFEVVLGSEVAKSTGYSVGSTVTFTHGMPGGRAAAEGIAPHVHEEHKFTVVGVLAPNGTSHDRALFTSLQSSWVIHAQDRLEAEHHAAHSHDHDGDGKADHAAHECDVSATVDDIIESDKLVTGIYVRVAGRGGATSAALPQVFEGIRRDGRFTVAQPKQEIDRLFGIVGNIDQLLVAMAGVVMISSGIAIMLALYNSMEQRRRQIAVLRVLGASRPRIFGLVVTESAILGVIGAIVGVVLAFVGTNLVAGILKERLGLVVDPALPGPGLIVVAIATVVLAALAGIVPAVMAYRTSVARNLRPIG
jgi:putative ABC transport system permease protein